jgi:hypothetical protein
MIVVECCWKIGPDAAKALNCWRPRRDLNPSDFKVARWFQST